MQQITGNSAAQINSVIHLKDLVGKSVVMGGNRTEGTYVSTAADGTKITVGSADDGRGFFSNLLNIMRGTATPHSCYGTAKQSRECDKQWTNIPKSNAPDITNPNYKGPAVIPQYQSTDKTAPQVQRDSNTQMNQLLTPAAPALAPQAPRPRTGSRLETLRDFKKEQ